jgi:hypothetical protein
MSISRMSLADARRPDSEILDKSSVGRQPEVDELRAAAPVFLCGHRLTNFAVWPDERPSTAVVSVNLMGCAAHLRGRLCLEDYRAMRCLSFLLVTAAPLRAAQDERPVPPLPIAPSQATARDHARALSEMADTAARRQQKCQSSGAALGSQAYKECRALLEDKMSIENDVASDRSYARPRGR